MDILGKNVTITYHRYENDSSTMGEWLPETNTIRIRMGIPEDEKPRVLLHEVAHVVWQSTGAPNRKIGEEDFATLCELFLEIFKKRE